MASAIPEGYSAVTPFLTVTDAARALDFYKRAFGAVEVFRLAAADGERLLHAELQIGGARLMLADCSPEFGRAAPARDGAGVGIHLYVADVDAVVAQAVDAGARITVPVADMFWGDRFGRLLDPFGVTWSVATHIKDLTPGEIAAGAKRAMGG